MTRRQLPRPLYLNSESLMSMVDNHEISRETAKIIIKNRPYRSFRDLIGIREFAERVSLDDLFRVLPGAYSLPFQSMMPITERGEIQKIGDIEYSVNQLINDTIMIAINDSRGFEIVSAELDPKTNDIDIASIRFATLEPWSLLRLHPEDRFRLVDYLHSTNAKDAGLIWKELNSGLKSKGKDIQKAVSHLSQIFQIFQYATQPRNYENFNIDDCDPDGCTGVPDFDIKECCDAHDYCYCLGGDEEDRQICDDVFYECIKDKGHPILALIYLLGVEALGDSHFNYHVKIDYIEGEPAIIFNYPEDEEPPQTSDCRVKVRVLQVSYRGKNIGNDWTYRVGVEGQSTRLLNDGRHDRGQIRYYNRGVFNKLYSDRCGSSFYINLSASAREEDAIWDDNGSKQVNYLVKCDPDRPFMEYQFDLEVKIKERKWYGFGRNIARLVFTFEIETKCE